MHSLWALKLSRDEQLPEYLLCITVELLYPNQLSQLETISTPRFIVNVNTQLNCFIAETHAYCDAFKNDYGTCL